MNCRRAAIGFPMILLLACGPLGAWIAHARSEPKPNREAVQDFMRAKLDASKSTLEGLVMEDFDEIAKQAVRLQAMSRRAEWNVIPGRIYQQLSTEFRNSAARLATAAQETNLDKASLAYVQVTINCLNCHKVVRGAKLVDMPGPSELQIAWASSVD